MQFLHERLVELLEIVVGNSKYVFTAVEGYAYSTKGGAVYTMAEVKQAILAAYCHIDLNMQALLLLPPTTWKQVMEMSPTKAQLGGVKLTQSEKKKWGMAALRKYDERVEVFGNDHNCFDAYAMAATYYRFVRSLPNPAIMRLRKRETELYNSIREALKRR